MLDESRYSNSVKSNVTHSLLGAYWGINMEGTFIEYYRRAPREDYIMTSGNHNKNYHSIQILI